MTRSITAVPITAEAFAPFGQLLQAPAQVGRDYFSAALANSRASASPSLSITHTPPVSGSRLLVTEMERHEFSSQSFIPIDVSRFLVVVAPHDGRGRPDGDQARAFILRSDQGVTYGENVWHHSLTVLDRVARLAVLMWTDPAGGDEEFVRLAAPFQVSWKN